MRKADREREITGEGLKRKGLQMSDNLYEQMQLYKELIRSWSKRINLLSGKDIGLIIEDHFLDSIGPINEFPMSGQFIDIGSGSGFPGIPLALLRPQATFTLTESVHKKILFLREVKRKLELGNVEIIEGRFEDLLSERIYDIATVRALPKIESFIEKIKKIVRPGGKIVYYYKRGQYQIMPITGSRLPSGNKL